MQAEHIQEAHMRRDVLGVASMENFSPLPHHSEMKVIPIRPLSPTPEQGILMELPTAPLPSNLITTRIIEPAVQASTVVKMEVPNDSIAKLDTTKDSSSPPSMVSSSPSSVIIPSSCTITSSNSSVNNSSSQEMSVAPHSASSHEHVYNHRDHPRRRHRQAQLEQHQKEEEERIQQQQQQMQQLAARPHCINQTLDSLVQAICHVEGSKALCDERKFYDYDDDQKMYDRRQVVVEDSERDASSISDLEESKYICGRDSPLHSSSHHYLHPQQKPQQIITSHCLPPPVISKTNAFTEKYPIAHKLIHCVSSPYRPDVIVHKQS